MMNVKHFFSIHHNDLGLFLVQCYTYYRQYKHKCVVKIFENIVFILRTHKYTVKLYFIFPAKTMYTVYIPFSTNTKLHIHYIQNNRIFTVYSVESMHQLWDSLAT